MRTVAWLIEGASVYWGGRSPDYFVSNIDDAVRFSRYEDADRILGWIIPQQMRILCRVAEHVWVEAGGNKAVTIFYCDLCDKIIR